MKLLLRASFAAAWLALSACSTPCDELVDKRCECGPQVCRAARDELKLSTELLRSLGGSSGREMLAERCRERLRGFSCTAKVPAPKP